MTDTDALVGSRIRIARDQKQYSVQAVARACRMTEQHLRSVEEGHVRPDPVQIVALADELGVSVTMFFVDAETGPAAPQTRSIRAGG